MGIGHSNNRKAKKKNNISFEFLKLKLQQMWKYLINIYVREACQKKTVDIMNLAQKEGGVWPESLFETTLK